MRVSEFDYDLPDDLIARHPAEPRDAARLLVLDRASPEVDHRKVRDLPDLLAPGDLLVVNDTRVLPHRLVGRRATGGAVETLILERDGSRCRGYLKPAAKMVVGRAVAMEGGALSLIPEVNLGGGLFEFRLEADGRTVEEALEAVGRAPLPPYIRRADEDVARDRDDYQTMFASEPGAVAAPTAGLHFTPDLLDRLAARGVELARVTLHVGIGTFAPIRVDTVEDHEMHSEHFVLPEATAEAVAATRERGGRVIAVGTTSARTLESRAEGRLVRPGAGDTQLFLYPGRSLQVVDALFTNFHLPQSTLLMLVSAFASRERILAAYREAVARRYRFFSFGDAMLIV